MKNKEIIKKQIFQYLKEGMIQKDAAVLACIDESTFYRWMSADASFASSVQASVLEYKRSLIQTINSSLKKDGRLALEMLRRRWPQDERIAKESNSVSAIQVTVVRDKEHLKKLNQQKT